MIIPVGTTVAVADGEKLNLFHTTGDANSPQLRALPHPDVDDETKGSGASRGSSSGNPDESQAAEDGFTVGIADILNRRVLDGSIKNLIVIAAPRTLGELRKHYHKNLIGVLVGEIDKDLTGHQITDIEKTIAAA
jgi:protein required for attachment to host cells